MFRQLGYPMYLLRFIGAAKILAVAILAPTAGWLKEWAYAGLTFTMIGASYSHQAAGNPPSALVFPLIALCLVIAATLLQTDDDRGPGPGRTIFVTP